MRNLMSNLPIGATIFYYNKWSGFENNEIRGCFTFLNKTQQEALKEGDLVWRDEEPYNGNGKVYGWTLKKVAKISNEGERVKIYFTDGNFSTLRVGAGLALIKDGMEDKLAELIEKNPESRPLIETE